MRNSRSEHRAKGGLTFVLEPFLRPGVCTMAKREFVEFVGKDLREQRVLNVQHCFSMVIVKIGQSGVVSADGLGDGEGGVSGHGRRAQAIGSPVL